MNRFRCFHSITCVEFLILFSNLTPFLGVGAFGAAGGRVELVPDPGAEALRVRGADPCAFLFGPAEELNLGCHIFRFGIGIAVGVALAGVAVWCGVVCHFRNITIFISSCCRLGRSFLLLGVSDDEA